MRRFLSTPPEATLESPDYAIIAMVRGSLSEPGFTLGTKGRCRFCDRRPRTATRPIFVAGEEAVEGSQRRIGVPRGIRTHTLKKSAGARLLHKQCRLS